MILRKADNESAEERGTENDEFKNIDSTLGILLQMNIC
jgi:hypothetical protein